MNQTFRHAGDIGDIIYFLPVMRHFGGGELLIEAAQYTRVRLHPEKWCGIDRLFLQQDYVTAVNQWSGQKPFINGNDFRARMMNLMRRGEGKQKNLADWMLETHGAPYTAKDHAWITVKNPNQISPVVINRSGAGRQHTHCYHNALFPWHKVWKKYKDKAVFIGLQEEYDAFCVQCGEIPYVVTKDLAEAAEVIAGCKLFIGNQSACHAIAEGMKKSIVLEVWTSGPNCLFFRQGVYHGWDQNVTLPDV